MSTDVQASHTPVSFTKQELDSLRVRGSPPKHSSPSILMSGGALWSPPPTTSPLSPSKRSSTWHPTSFLKRLKSPPPAALTTQAERKDRRVHGRSNSFSEGLKKLLPSHRSEKGGTLRAKKGDGEDASGQQDFPRDVARAGLAVGAGDQVQDRTQQADAEKARGPFQAHVWVSGTGDFQRAGKPLPDVPPAVRGDGTSGRRDRGGEADLTFVQRMFEDKRNRRQQRRSLKESGDYLGVQGANPRTGYWDVSSGSEPSEMSDETKRKLDEEARKVEEQKRRYDEAEAKHKWELERVLSLRAKKRKYEQRMKQRRHGKWQLSDNGWSSVAEPELSPIVQSVVGSPNADLAPGDRLFPMPTADDPTPYISGALIRPQDYFGHRAASSLLMQDRLSSRSSGRTSLERQHPVHRKAVDSPSPYAKRPSVPRQNTIPRKEVGSPSRRKSNESSITIVHNPAILIPVKQKPGEENGLGIQGVQHLTPQPIVHVSGPQEIGIQVQDESLSTPASQVPGSGRRSSLQSVADSKTISRPGPMHRPEGIGSPLAPEATMTKSHSAPGLHRSPQQGPLNSQQANRSPKAPALATKRYPSRRLSSFLEKEARWGEYEDPQERKASAIPFQSVSTKQVQVQLPSAESQRNVSRQTKVITCLNELPPIKLKPPYAASIPSSYPPKESYPVWMPPTILKTEPDSPPLFTNTIITTTTGIDPYQHLPGQTDGPEDFMNVSQGVSAPHHKQRGMTLGVDSAQSTKPRKRQNESHHTHPADIVISSERHLEETKQRTARLCQRVSPDGERVELKNTPISISTSLTPERESQAARSAARMAFQHRRHSMAKEKAEDPVGEQLSPARSRKQKSDEKKGETMTGASPSGRGDTGNRSGNTRSRLVVVRREPSVSPTRKPEVIRPEPSVSPARKPEVIRPEPSVSPAREPVLIVGTQEKQVILPTEAGNLKAENAGSKGTDDGDAVAFVLVHPSETQTSPAPSGLKKKPLPLPVDQVMAGFWHSCWVFVEPAFNAESAVRKRFERQELTVQDWVLFAAAGGFVGGSFLVVVLGIRVLGAVTGAVMGVGGLVRVLMGV
ncbi:uncharacterized protein L3040_001755 [Drepanopeziza brunnea f. sp. 'multigermtubi']|uniref:Uncharacterized protein n=1 Tax=Marssonina brunnea f. sp. multigermtubi (strain MB_m1) TaxID=1072389 RepID=K1X3U1_MARBU|nr:uncharacterized protein MBM_06604 [Drepanopeziza brunnea f. sp. 'multigermtubi' MB_m1]EKD15388.1 hypothetical protein MBM_06604 [Drepanopeziza brunnea f. sp. 'multigermtubi' MB_m1]KAJ5051995.1 hypothetical protein L3040_001755 [Drepanopeziza brunnea f. sp. 'multigermtubi']